MRKKNIKIELILRPKLTRLQNILGTRVQILSIIKLICFHFTDEGWNVITDAEEYPNQFFIDMALERLIVKKEFEKYCDQSCKCEPLDLMIPGYFIGNFSFLKI